MARDEPLLNHIFSPNYQRPRNCWFVVGNDEQHLLPGDAFALERDVPHIERYGAEGATYWVARRN